MKQNQRHAHAVNPRRKIIYYPKERPGHVAWTTGFSYGDGSVGLVFQETLIEKNPLFQPPAIELGEALGAPVSYSSVFIGKEDQRTYRHYLRSYDNGETFIQTGRSPMEESSFCNVGFPDGRILGFDVPKLSQDRTSWAHYLRVRESMDGGNTWSNVTRLLDGNAIYLWRVRQLKDNTIIILASFFGTAWGPHWERKTRTALLPGETHTTKYVPFFLTTKDGYRFSGPHYVLPGVGAHEYDVVETQEGHLLFITGDVQATPVARQLVRRENGRYINEPLQTIEKGAPEEGAHPQSGYVPETIVALPDGTLVGSRRNQHYSCSSDQGKNWFPIGNLGSSLYQPFMLLMPDGTVANFGHFGGDISFGQEDMYVGVDLFTLESHLPKQSMLEVTRQFSEDNSHYENRYQAKLTCGDEPVPGQEILFSFQLPRSDTPPLLPERSPFELTAITDAEGIAEVAIKPYDKVRDIHFSYTTQAFFNPPKDSPYLPSASSITTDYAMRPYREKLFPYDAYFAESKLFLSPKFLERYPEAIQELTPLCEREEDWISPESIQPKLAELLIQAGVLYKEDTQFRWKPSINQSYPLGEVLPMRGGDWYV